MSLSGDFNDLLTGNPLGSADAQSAAIAAGQQVITDSNANTYNQILAAQGQTAADNYQATVNADFSSQAPDSNSLAATAEIAGAAASGALDAAANPGQVLQTGLAWEGNAVGSAAASVANSVKGGVGNLFGALPWWLYLVAAATLFLWLGGGELLEGKARKRIASL